MRRYASYVRSRGHEVHVLHCPLQERVFEPAEPPPGLEVHEALSRPGRTSVFDRVGEIARATRLLRRLRPDVVHLLCSRAGAQAIARFCRAPVVFTPWGADVLQDAHANAFHHGRTRFLLASVRGIVAASDAMLRRACELTGPAHLVRARWGLDFETFHARDRESARRELGIPENAFCVLSPRQWGTKYNVQMIIDALAALRDRGVDVCGLFKYCIVQGDLERVFAERLRVLGLEGRVQIHGPSNHPEDSQRELARCFRAADAFVSIPTWDGGSPSTLFEGMACGCVPVVSDIDTHTEYVQDGLTGHVLPHVSVADLTNRLEAMALDREGTRLLATRLPQRARQLATTDDEMERVLALYRRVSRRPEHLFHASPHAGSEPAL